MKTSAILRRAADKHLAIGESYVVWPKWEFSCDAASANLGYANHYRVIKALIDFGVPVQSTYAFDSFPEGEIRQGARFLWLDFAALVLESEGD